MSVLEGLRVPIVQAPMAGGPSTPRLAAAVSSVGGIGFLAAGYLDVDRLASDISTLRALTDAPFGVNVFVPPSRPADPRVVDSYAHSLQRDAERLRVTLGEPRFDDDWFGAKIDALCRQPVPVVSFTFGPPPHEVVQRLTAAGSEVWTTVTSPDEADAAAERGSDVLIVQGIEAGGHRGTHADDDAHDLTLLAALQLIRARVSNPLVAAGGLATGEAVAAVVVAGAAAAQLGTAYLRCPEAGTSTVHRSAIATRTPTVLTRAFTGRLARGIRNRFHDDHSSAAPCAYPEVHHLTAPLRAHGRSNDNREVVNLWAGQAHELAADEPAAALTLRLASDARHALEGATERFATLQQPGEDP